MLKKTVLALGICGLALSGIAKANLQKIDVLESSCLDVVLSTLANKIFLQQSYTPEEILDLFKNSPLRIDSLEQKEGIIVSGPVQSIKLDEKGNIILEWIMKGVPVIVSQFWPTPNAISELSKVSSGDKIQVVCTRHETKPNTIVLSKCFTEKMAANGLKIAARDRLDKGKLEQDLKNQFRLAIVMATALREDAKLHCSNKQNCDNWIMNNSLFVAAKLQEPLTEKQRRAVEKRCNELRIN